jgi:glycosyltransferase involved in cell wall biosynthesis
MNPRLHRQSTVLAVITRYRCESWLAQAIESPLKQTHPLDGIAVIDDASPEPPIEIVRRFPRVTLLTAEEKVGPYRLIQAFIDHTHYDAYLQQDADDWPSPERLAVLLVEAELTGAELLGTWFLNIWSCGDEEYQELKSYPADVNAAYRNEPDGWFGLMQGDNDEASQHSKSVLQDSR